MIKRILFLTALAFHQMPQQVQTGSSSQNEQIVDAQRSTSITCVAITTDGINYTCALNPSLLVYSPNMMLIANFAMPNFAGAKLNVDSIGPIAVQGTCNQVCILLAVGSPVNAFVVH